jgi:hypothetical protein
MKLAMDDTIAREDGGAWSAGEASALRAWACSSPSSSR